MGSNCRALQPLRDSDLVERVWASGESIPKMLDAIRTESGLRIDPKTLKKIAAQKGLPPRKRGYRQSRLTDAEALKMFRHLQARSRENSPTYECAGVFLAEMCAYTGLSIGGTRTQVRRGRMAE